MAPAEGTPLATFAAEVRAHRQRLGWSQVVLGEKIGYSGSFVSDVERCERQPALDFAISQARKQKVVDNLWKGLQGLMRARKITTVIGTGTLPASVGCIRSRRASGLCKERPVASARSASGTPRRVAAR